MENFYFTFGCGMGLARYHVKLIGSMESTRVRMFELFGDKWSFQYNEIEFNTRVLPHYPAGLIEIELPIGMEICHG